MVYHKYHIRLLRCLDHYPDVAVRVPSFKDGHQKDVVSIIWADELTGCGIPPGESCVYVADHMIKPDDFILIVESSGVCCHREENGWVFWKRVFVKLVNFCCYILMANLHKLNLI